jgi:hypothetical protein
MPDETKQAKPSTPAATAAPKPVKFIHEKGAQYRVFHADGAWGVINQFGNLQMDFCVERPPTPSAVLQPVDPQGNAAGEQVMEGLGNQDYFNVVRDFQCGVVLSFAAAVQVHSVLDVYIKSSKHQMDIALAQMKQQK